MENRVRIKMLIKDINSCCDKLDTSIFEVLENRRLNVKSFFLMFFEDPNILDLDTLEQLSYVVCLKKARFDYINNNEDKNIGIYDPDSGIYVSLNENGLSFQNSKEEYDSEYKYETEEGYYAVSNDGVKRLHFWLSTVLAKKDIEEKVATHNCYYRKFKLGVIYECNGEKYEGEITIPDDVNYKDYVYIKRLLSTLNYEGLLKYFTECNASIKVISDKVLMNKNNNR